MCPNTHKIIYREYAISLFIIAKYSFHFFSSLLNADDARGCAFAPPSALRIDVRLRRMESHGDEVPSAT